MNGVNRNPSANYLRVNRTLTEFEQVLGPAGPGLARNALKIGAEDAVKVASISTNAPLGAAGVWRVGKVTVGAVALDAANYVEVMIDGVVVKLLKAS